MKRTHADFKRTVLDIAYERQFEEKPFPHIEAVEKAMEHFENLVHEHAQAHGTHAAGNMSEVYMADMVSGLSHMIWNEVPNRKEISSHSFTALKKFLGLIGDVSE
ncbi:uncharacterized protein LOC110240927 [Exaiptasia diaphana]|uniref:Uncharacterized protein n=1 Tax=Exaiptasia diaphana TaxID=2652724 RepID=A0A913XDH7_EXADI|nr:uncharacterized protein LOC110240927 [Exaiptasia diaphana]